jgi:hypothetical protein
VFAPETLSLQYPASTTSRGIRSPKSLFLVLASPWFKLGVSRVALKPVDSRLSLRERTCFRGAKADNGDGAVVNPASLDCHVHLNHALASPACLS